MIRQQHLAIRRVSTSSCAFSEPYASPRKDHRFEVLGTGRISNLDRTHPLAVQLQPEDLETRQRIELQEIFFSWYATGIHVCVDSNGFADIVSL